VELVVFEAADHLLGCEDVTEQLALLVAFLERAIGASSAPAAASL